MSKYQQRYEIDFKWRAAWSALANKTDNHRLQSVQEYIEHRAVLANRRIAKLMRDFDLAMNTWSDKE